MKIYTFFFFNMNLFLHNFWWCGHNDVTRNPLHTVKTFGLFFVVLVVISTATETTNEGLK